MSEPDLHPYNLIAIGSHGVYAICMYRPGHPTTHAFLEETLTREDRIERVPVGEAVEPYRRTYLMQLKGSKNLLPDSARPSNYNDLDRNAAESKVLARLADGLAGHV